MISAEMKKTMQKEAVERMQLLGVSEDAIELFKSGSLQKVNVDHRLGVIIHCEPTAEELQMVKEIEDKYEEMTYYLIMDEGIWPDGCLFPRYTLATVDTNVNDYDFVKDDCIGACKTLPAYIVNMEDPDCSEISEFGYRMVSGTLINIT